jgi:hypothetical protein
VRWLACEVARREIVLLCLATPLLLFPGIWSLAGLAIIALTWGCRRVARGAFSARTAMDVPIVLLLVFSCISLLPSVDLALSLNRMCVLVLGVALFYGTVNGIHDQRSLQALGTGLVLVGLAVALISLLSADFQAGRLIKLPVVYEHLPPPLIRGLPGSGVLQQYDLVNPRLVAGTLAILLPIPLAYLALGHGKKLRLLSGLAASVMLGVLALTQSPQGLLGLGAAVLLMVLLWNRWSLLALPLGAGALLLASRYIGFQQFLGRLLGPEGMDSLLFNLNSRFVNGARGVGLIRDMPYTGSGLNNFPILDGLYSSGSSHAVHAHNVFIQTATDFGVPGAVVLLALVAAFGYTAARVFRARPTGNERALLIGICGAMAAWLAYGLLDCITLGHKPAVALWVMLGLAANMRLRVDPLATQAVPFPARLTRRWVLAVLLPVVLLGATIGLTRRRLIGALFLNLGVLEAHRALALTDSPDLAAQHLQLAEAHLSRSVEWDPGRPRTRRVLEWVLQGDISGKHWPRDTARLEQWRTCGATRSGTDYCLAEARLWPAI